MFELLRTGKPGVLWSMGSQKAGHDWVIKQQRVAWQDVHLFCGNFFSSVPSSFTFYLCMFLCFNIFCIDFLCPFSVSFCTLVQFFLQLFFKCTVACPIYFCFSFFVIFRSFQRKTETLMSSFCCLKVQSPLTFIFWSYFWFSLRLTDLRTYLGRFLGTSIFTVLSLGKYWSGCRIKEEEFAFRN